jgi:hypothetical protein
MKFQKKYREIMESLRGDGSPKNAVIKDVQVGNLYLMVQKKGKKYVVKKGRGPTANKAKMRTVFKGSEEKATAKMNKLWKKAVNDL